MKPDSLVLFLGLALSLACGGGGGVKKEDPPPIPAVTVTLTPGAASLRVGATQAFTATATAPNRAWSVSWSIREGLAGGTITSQGLYTAPAVPGTYHVVATAADENMTSASAPVTVTAVPPRRLSLVAGGIGGEGSADGVGASAGFYYPGRVALDALGNVYVADTHNHTIRKITPSGQVTTLAGSVGKQGSADGSGSSARFKYPEGLAVDGSGNLFVADSANHSIRKVTQTGVVTTFVGVSGQGGTADGLGSAARFFGPFDLALDGAGNLYVTDAGNDIIRKVTPGGLVSTFAGMPRVNGSADGVGTDARFNVPSGIAADGVGNVYVTELANHTIRKITPSGVVSTLAGLAGSLGSADGSGSAARFAKPRDIALDVNGNLYVGDGNFIIRKISPGGDVSTFAGSAGAWGHRDGTGPAAVFYGPGGVAVDPSGTLYVADSWNHVIRKSSPTAEVSTFAGSPPSRGSADGSGAEARFDRPEGMAVDGGGNTYVADILNQTIRKITPAGEVSVLAGGTRQPGYADGPMATARFSYPEGVAVDAAGTVYVADTQNHLIRKISPSGVVSTLAGTPAAIGNSDGMGASARFNFPRGIAVDTSGNCYVMDSENRLVRKVSPAGEVTTLAGDLGGTAITVDGVGNVYVVSGAVWKISPNGLVVNLAGASGQNPGFQDGIGSAARFWSPKGIAVDASGTLYVSDEGNHAIRKIDPTGMVSTIAGLGGIPGIVVNQAPGGLSRPWGIALAPNGDLVISTSNAILRAVKQ